MKALCMAYFGNLNNSDTILRTILPFMKSLEQSCPLSTSMSAHLSKLSSAATVNLDESHSKDETFRLSEI